MPYLGHPPSTGEENNFKILDDISSYTLTFDGSSSSVVSTSDETIYSYNHRFVQGQRVTYNNGGGGNIAGLTSGTVYFIIKEDHNNIKLATSASNATAGTAINLTAVGTGSSHTLNVAFDGVNTKFKATHTTGQKARITRGAQLVISVNGVIQQPHDSSTPSTGFGFDVDGTIILSQAPESSDAFWGHILTNNNVTFDISDNKIDHFTGDGSTSSFTLSKSPPNNENILVTIDGVVQYPNDGAGNIRAYSVAANIINFTSAPGSGTAIEVRHIGFAGATSGGGGGVTGFYGRTGNAVLKSTDHITTGNIVAGVVTATNAVITGDLTVNGTTTTLDTDLIGVDKIEVAANNTTVAVAVTQSGAGDLIRLFDSTTEKLRITDDGLVGIGTNNPTRLMSIEGNINLASGSKIESYSSGGNLQIQGGSTYPGGHIKLYGGSGDDMITFNTTGASISSEERLRIKSDGKVGINTATFTSAQFVVRNSDDANLNTIEAWNDNGNVSSSLSQTSAGDGVIGIHQNAGTITTLLRSNGASYITGGEVGIGTDNPGIQSSGANNLVVAEFGGEGGITIKNDTNSMGHIFFADTDATAQGRIDYGHSGDYMRFYTANDERLRINSDGEVGIGTANPQSRKLHVLGTTRPVEIGSTNATNIVKLYNSGTGRATYNGVDIMASSTDGAKINAYGGSIMFGTSASNGSDVTERLRITSGGDVSVSGDGTVHGISKLTIKPANRTNAFSPSDGDTWHDVVIKHEGDAANNAVGLAFEVSPSAYHKNAGTGIAAVKNGTGSDYGSDLVFVTRPQSAAAQERLRIKSDGQVRIQSSGSNNVPAKLQLHSEDTSISSGDHIGEIRFTGRDSAGAGTEAVGALIDVTAAADWNTGATGYYPSNIDFHTQSNTGTDTVAADSPRMRIAADGNVGIGIANPSNKLEISGGLVRCLGSASARFTANNGSAEGFIGFNSGTFHIGEASASTQIAAAGANYITMNTNSNERLRILADGEVLIGGRNDWGGGNLHPNTGNKLVITGPSPANVYNNILYLEGSETSGAVNTGGALAFGGHDGSQYRNWGNIYGMKENGTGGNRASYMSFHTRAAGGDPAEKMRITSDGDVGVGNDSPNCRLAVKDTTDALTAYANATPSVGDCMAQLYYNPSSETVNDHATLQFGINGGSHNRVNTISAVAESASNRKLAFTFCTDSGSNRNERMRIAGDGKVMIGTSDTGYAAYGDMLTVYQSNHCGITIRTDSNKWGALWFADSTTGDGRYIGGVDYSHTDDFMRLLTGGTERIRIQGTGTICQLKLYNYANTDASATCEIQANHDIRDSSKIVFGRETADDYSASWASQTSFLAFHTHNGSSGLQEQLRITSGGKFYLNDNSKKEIAPVYHDYVSCTGDAWTKFATISGNQLSSEIYMTAQDTLNSVVITASFLIKVAHYQDIWIESRSMAYSELKIKVISNNNQNYDLYMQRTSGSSASNVEVSIFPKNQETVTFSSTVNYSGQELEHTTAAGTIKVTGAGGVQCNINMAGSITGSSKNFSIEHPLTSLAPTKKLVHASIEGPQLDLIYRGKVDLVGGSATVNIDTAAGMSEGTFVLMNSNVQCFTTNETGWSAIKGSVSGNVLTITAQDNSSTDTISWMVVGERQDDTIKSSNVTDDSGKLIVEPLIFEEPDNSSKAEYYPTS